MFRKLRGILKRISDATRSELALMKRERQLMNRPRKPKRKREKIIGPLPKYLQREAGWRLAERNLPMLTQQACIPALQRLERGIRQSLRAESGRGRAADGGAASDRDHVMEGRN